MLLRRITKHIKEQNWFAVGIDFVIVVFGVFIGIQHALLRNAVGWVERSDTHHRFTPAARRVSAFGRGTALRLFE